MSSDELSILNRGLGVDHRYVSVFQSVPGVALVLGYTITSEVVEQPALHLTKAASRLHQPLLSSAER